MLTGFPILSTLIWLPIVGGLLVLFAGRNNPTLAKWLSLFTVGLTFILSISLWTGFDTTTASMQFVENVPWIPMFNVNYY
ncbi:NADH-ubiquinone oxidoreductase chain M, partial [hydrothermal vent metagenome]